MSEPGCICFTNFAFVTTPLTIYIYIYIHTVFGLLSIFTTPWEWAGFSPHPCLSLSRFPGVANVATSPG